MSPVHRHRLAGVRSLPLAHYLKGLGIHRLVAEQADPSARTSWVDGEMILDTTLDRVALESFFLDECRPTPIVSPWNGGSGFYAKDNRDGFDPILRGTGHRFAEYRSILETSMSLVRELGLDASPKDDEKRDLIDRCRGRLSDAAIEWIDAAVVLADERSVYAPLLGTGGNDGRFEFSSNLMRRWIDLVDPSTDAPTPRARSFLGLALYADNTSNLAQASIGQFLPASAAGANPWDFVLMIEGALMFAGAAVRRLGPARGASSAPFTVDSTSAGYGSSSGANGEDSRGEIWLPLWTDPSKLSALRAVFAEGRATIGRRAARDGIDFARAIAGLGVDRGIDGFERVGFHVRNGLSYFATPLGHFDVRRRPAVDLLASVDPWMDQVRRICRSDGAPKSMVVALNRLDAAILDVARRESADRFQAILVSLAELEATFASRRKLVDDPKFQLRPLALDGRNWIEAIDDGSPELRLAFAFAFASLQTNDAPLRLGAMVRRVRRGKKGGLEFDASDDPRFVWKDGMSTERGLLAVLRRTAIETQRSGDGTLALESVAPARLADVSRFVFGDLDDGKLERLIRSVLLFDRGFALEAAKAGSGHVTPSTMYATLAVAHFVRLSDGRGVPIDPEIIASGMAGDGFDASRRAVRRLRASGVRPSIEAIPVRGDEARRATAALAFPISVSTTGRLRDLLCRREEFSESDEGQGVKER